MYYYLLSFSASILSVGLKSLQQLNVQHEWYVWIIPTSLLLTASEYLIVVWVVKDFSLPMVVSVGLGAGIGSTLATRIHKELRKGKNASGS
jgi:hypothetical protein